MSMQSSHDARVVKALEDAADSGLDALGLSAATGLWLGTVYPILIRLEREELIKSASGVGRMLNWQLAPTSSDKPDDLSPEVELKS